MYKNVLLKPSLFIVYYWKLTTYNYNIVSSPVGANNTLLFGFIIRSGRFNTFLSSHAYFFVPVDTYRGLLSTAK